MKTPLAGGRFLLPTGAAARWRTRAEMPDVDIVTRARNQASAELARVGSDVDQLLPATRLEVRASIRPRCIPVDLRSVARYTFGGSRRRQAEV